MASELYTFDHCFFSDQFSPFSDNQDVFSTLDDILAATTNGGAATSATNQEDTKVTLDSLNALLISSPPRREGLDNLSSYMVPEPLKSGEFSVPFDAVNGGAGGGSGVSGSLFAVAQQPSNGGRTMQRSYSSNSFDGKAKGASFFYRPSFTGLLESPFQPDLSSALVPFQTDFSSATQIRRACSTGDLQVNSTQNRAIFPPSPPSIEGFEEPNFRIGKYSPEERRMKIHRYRLKRNQRNFNKTIKYACRKTLADNRPRIRGRFARNDEVVEISRASSSSMFHRYGENGDHLWVESDHGGSFGGGKPFYNTFGSAPSSYQYYNSY